MRGRANNYTDRGTDSPEFRCLCRETFSFSGERSLGNGFFETIAVETNVSSRRNPTGAGTFPSRDVSRIPCLSVEARCSDLSGDIRDSWRTGDSIFLLLSVAHCSTGVGSSLKYLAANAACSAAADSVTKFQYAQGYRYPR